jgi:hypothetical protein
MKKNRKKKQKKRTEKMRSKSLTAASEILAFTDR